MARQLDDVIGLGLDLAQQREGSSDASSEGRPPHGTSKLELSAVVGEVNHSIDVIDLGHILTEIHDAFAKITLSHVHSPSLKYAERFGIGPQSNGLIQPVIFMVNGVRS